MKTRCTKLFVLTVVLSVFSQAQQSPPSDAPHSGEVRRAASLDDSPAQLRIDAAKRQIKADTKKVKAFNDLAMAFLRRARETADPGYFQDAEQALAQGFQLDPKDFQLQKTQVALMLGRHQFAQAKEKATLLNRQTPDDVMTYGYIAEADIALGDYAEAEKSAQWMLNMRPNNVPGLLLAAKLRVLFGDSEGALELLNLAYTETSPTEVEELASIANQIASVQIDSGKSEAAIPVLERAGQLFPRYPYTLENLARVRLMQHRANDAVALLLQAKQMDTNPHVLYELAQAQRAAGQSADAIATTAEFKKIAKKQASEADNANRDLILMDAEDSAGAQNALKLAQHVIEMRHDVWTLDAYAWALYANGKFQDADAAIRKAIDVGIQSAQIFNHAGHIAQKLGHQENASSYFELSMRADPSSEYASDSRRAAGLPTYGGGKTPPSSQPTQTPAQQQATVPATKPEKQSANSTAMANRPAETNSAPAFSPVPAALLTPRPTETDRLIHNAQVRIERSPKDAAGYAGLGAAYFQRARESGDVNDYQLAEQSLTKSLDLVTADFSADAALRTMAEVCMGEHRFADALSYSQKALSLGSGDVSSFAIIGDANADLGEYDQAAVAYGRLSLDGSEMSARAAYARDSRVSYLKFISGDSAGAIRLMKTAVAEGLQSQLPSENIAWLYYELGEYSTQAGDTASADAAYLAALAIHPGDYRALAGLAKLRGNQGRYAEATLLYQKAIAVVPMPIFVAELGDLYSKSGVQAEAKKQYQLVEYIGLLGHINQVLHNRDLAIFYADHDIKLTEALELAQKEFEVRHDIYTWDALAWALYKNGKYAEAGKASEKALQFGTQDSLLLFHAGMIAEKLGRRDQARDELKAALTINPHFHLIYADAAQQQLALLESKEYASAGGDKYAH